MIAARRLALVAALLAAAATAAAAARPARIVSINPCIDAVLMQVADPSQIAAISHYSQDARATSIPLAQARQFRVTSGTAEEVVALRPDIVLAGAHVAPSTIAALARLRVPVLTFPVPASLAEARAQVLAIAKAAEQPARGAALAARMASAETAARRPGPGVPALIWQSGGLVPGSDTLADELLRTAGFRNVSTDYGLQRWDVLPIEYLAARPPRVLFGDTNTTDRMTSHPVLAHLQGRMLRADFPERLLSCAGPSVIPALARLSAARDAL